MSNLQLPYINNYTRAVDVLKGRGARTIAYATKLEADPYNAYLGHHGSLVFKWYANAPDRVTFGLAGWGSNTTVNRVNHMLRDSVGLTLGRHKGKLMLSGLPGGHALEIAASAVYTVEDRSDYVLVQASGYGWQDADAGHRTYKFYR